MRLDEIKSRHSVPARIKLFMMGWLGGHPPEDVVHVLVYRREFFGRSFSRLVHAVLRGPSLWSVGERELFATRVSLANRCVFCASSHRPIAVLAMGAPAVGGALGDGPGPAPSPRVGAMLQFLGKLADSPGSVTPSDIEPLRAVGLSDSEIEDGIRICSLFGIINRIANALDFNVPPAADLERTAGFLLRFGYRM